MKTLNEKQIFEIVKKELNKIIENNELNRLGFYIYVDTEIINEIIIAEKDWGKEENRWNYKIQIMMNKEYKFKQDREYIKNLLKNLTEEDIERINFCVKILEKIREKEYLVKLFDKVFILLLKNKYRIEYDWNKRKKFYWVITEFDKILNKQASDYLIADEKEILVRLL